MSFHMILILSAKYDTHIQFDHHMIFIRKTMHMKIICGEIAYLYEAYIFTFDLLI